MQHPKMKRLRRYLVAGILVWAPLAVTFWLLRIAVNLMDKSLGLLPAAYRPGNLLQDLLGTEAPVHIPGLGIILTFLILLLTGVFAANFVGRAFVGSWESLLNRIPIVRSILNVRRTYSVSRGANELIRPASEKKLK